MVNTKESFTDTFRYLAASSLPLPVGNGRRKGQQNHLHSFWNTAAIKTPHTYMRVHIHSHPLPSLHIPAPWPHSPNSTGNNAVSCCSLTHIAIYSDEQGKGSWKDAALLLSLLMFPESFICIMVVACTFSPILVLTCHLKGTY